MDQREKDFEKYRGRIRRKIMHRVTRGVPPAHSEVWNKALKDRVSAAVKEVLAEELNPLPIVHGDA